MIISGTKKENTRSTYGHIEEYIQNDIQKSLSNMTLVRFRRRWENDVKMKHKKYDMKTWTAFFLRNVFECSREFSNFVAAINYLLMGFRMNIVSGSVSLVEVRIPKNAPK
jgi:hypothetical protein